MNPGLWYDIHKLYKLSKLAYFDSLCCGDVESTSHTLIHCPFSVEVWSAMIQDFGLSWVMSQDVSSMLTNWRTSTLNAKGRKIWRMVPAIVC